MFMSYTMTMNLSYSQIISCFRNILNIRLNFLDAKGCNTCEARDFCAGKCPLEPPSKNQRKGCEAVISLWRAVDKSIKNFGDYLNDSNEYKMEQ